jgi:cytosine/uracil/thiamine/allantoin permease
MSRSSKLYNSDLAPTPSGKKNWGWFEIFNVWANDVQSLFGYTLAASLFLASGLNGWAVTKCKTWNSISSICSCKYGCIWSKFSSNG